MDANARKQRVYDDLIAAGWDDEEITSFSECREITPQMAAALIGAWDGSEPDHGFCRGEFWCRERTADGSDAWLTIDNTSGDCWTENLRTEDAAKGCLLYGLCAEDVYDIDDGTYELDYLIRCSLQDEAELDDFDPEDYAAPDPGLATYKRPFENQWEQGKLDHAVAAERGVAAVSYALDTAVEGKETAVPSDEAVYVRQLPAEAQKAIYQKLMSRFEAEGFGHETAARLAQTGTDSKICDLEEVISKREVEAICATTCKPSPARGIDDVIGASRAQADLSAGDKENPIHSNDREARR